MRSTVVDTTYQMTSRQIQPNASDYVVTRSDVVRTRDLIRSEVTRNPIDDKGWRKPSPYWSRCTEGDNLFGEVVISSPNGRTRAEVFGRLLGRNRRMQLDVVPPSLLALPSAGHLSRGIVDARNNVADRVGSVMESIYEARKSAQFLAEGATKINNFISASERKYFAQASKFIGVHPRDPRRLQALRKLAKLSGTVGQSWLAFSFGLKPIVDDMVTAAIALSGAYNLRVTGKSLTLADKQVSTRSANLGLLSTWGPTFRAQLAEERVSGVYTRLDYEISAQYLRDLNKFGLLDAPTVLWAVQPYSWLIDFVVPVSDILSSMTATHGLDFKGGTQTVFRTSSSRIVDHTIEIDSSRLRNGWTVASNDVMYPAPSVRRESERKVFKTEPSVNALYMKDPFHGFAVTASLSLLAVKLKQHFS